MDDTDSPLLESLRDYENILPILGRIAIFGGLDEKELGIVFQNLQKVRYARGQIICKQGDLGRFIYIVKKGRAKMYLEESYTALELVEYSIGDCFGETALIGILPHSATVEAVEDSELIVLSGKNLYDLYKHDIDVYCKVLLNITRETCRRLASTDNVLQHYVMDEKKRGQIH